MSKESQTAKITGIFNSSQLREQEDSLFAKKPTTISSTKKLIDNLFNLPGQFIDFGSFLVDQAEASLELLRLKNDPVYRGKEKPRGDGSVIVILPGFGAVKSFYSDTEVYFKNCSFAPLTYLPTGVNLGNWENFLQGSVNFLKTQSEVSSRKLHVVGHSLGAYVMRIAAQDYSNELRNSVESIFLVGAPKPSRINLIIETGFLWSQLPFGVKKLDELLERFGALPESLCLPGVNVFELESEYDAIVRNGDRVQSANRSYFKSSHAGLLRDPDVLGFIREKLISNLPSAA